MKIQRESLPALGPKKTNPEQLRFIELDLRTSLEAHSKKKPSHSEFFESFLNWKMEIKPISSFRCE